MINSSFKGLISLQARQKHTSCILKVFSCRTSETEAELNKNVEEDWQWNIKEAGRREFNCADSANPPWTSCSRLDVLVKTDQTRSYVMHVKTHFTGFHSKFSWTGEMCHFMYKTNNTAIIRVQNQPPEASRLMNSAALSASFAGKRPTSEVVFTKDLISWVLLKSQSDYCKSLYSGFETKNHLTPSAACLLTKTRGADHISLFQPLHWLPVTSLLSKISTLLYLTKQIKSLQIRHKSAIVLDNLGVAMKSTLFMYLLQLLSDKWGSVEYFWFETS